MNESTRAELLERAKRDQAMRLETLKHPFKWDGHLAKTNAKYLKQLVEQDGWPTISGVGSDAAQAAWLLVQHADHDIEFQERCLTLMQNLPEAEVRPQNIAALTDRIRINRNLPQLYGTQFQGEGKKFGPYPIEDEARLDERRRQFGLESFAQYKARMIAQYVGTDAKK